MLEFAESTAPYDIVFVHGAGGNNLLWTRTLRYTSGSAHAFAVNLPGHPSGEITCRTVEEYSEVLGDFIYEKGLSRPVVCGHSMGSAISLTLAVEHPNTIGGLILVGGGAKLGVSPAILEGLRGKPLKAIEEIITPMSFYIIDLSSGREARKTLSISNLPVFLNDYLACNGFDVRNELHKITTRTLIVCGDKDRMTPPKWSHYLNANILNSELHFVRDSGHMLPLEKPEVFARLIQSFLANLSL
jgi:pimeloyl-ACP methyl ester carboxylesterase